MISEDRRKYVLLTDHEFEMCSNTDINFCTHKQALYTTSFSKSCIITLISADKTKIRNICSKSVSNHKDLTIVQYLSAGVWILISNRPHDVTIVCKESLLNQQLIKTTPLLYMIKLNNSCRAASNKFVIHEHYEWNERIRKPDSLGKLLKSYEISSMQFKDQLKTEFDNVSHIGIPSSLHDI